jgi:hypothetical protein
MYIEQNKLVNSMIDNSKQSHFKTQLENADSKTVFKIVNTLLNKDNKILPEHNSAKKLSDDFALFFTEKVEKIHSSLKTEQRSIDVDISYDHSVTCNLSEFKALSENDVVNLVNKRNSKSCLLDPLPTWYLKQNITVFGSVLTHILNMSLSTGIFPQVLKQAIINPIIKKQTLDPNDLKNYRPVANIPFLSKLLEKHVFNCINEHMEKYHLGEDLQSAYRSAHSTETALLHVKNYIMNCVHNQQGVFLVLLDLSAAFDTVEHNILVNRMANEIGLTGTALNWYRSYFTGRMTRVCIDDIFSEPHHMNYGLPQGSIVGPGSFKIYIIPIGRIIRKHHISYHMYADDIQLFLSFKPSDPNSIQDALAKLSACITEIKLWMTNNMLKLNDSKTEFFIAISPFNQRKMPPVQLQIGSEIVTPSDNVRNLGIIFDSQLSMSPHITGLCKSLSFQLRNISRTRRFLDQDSCHHIVRSLVLSRLDYGNALLLGINQSDLIRLQRLQNWASKLIFCAKKRDHVTPFLKQLHWLPIKERIQFKILLFVFKCVNNIGPSYLASTLSFYTPARTGLRSASDSTRLEEHRMYPRTLKSAADKSFYFTAPTLWNNLPTTLRSAVSVNVFKKDLKSYLFPY